MGGLAIFLGFLLSTLIFVPMSSSMRGMLLGGVIIVILGIFDDIYALPALPKLLVQIAAALVAVLHGNVIQVLSNPNIFSENPYWTLAPWRSPCPSFGLWPSPTRSTSLTVWTAWRWGWRPSAP